MKVLKKIHVCTIAVLIFWLFLEKIQKHVPPIPFSVSDPVFALCRPLENPRTLCAQKSGLG